jgi:hypothetical protein
VFDHGRSNPSRSAKLPSRWEGSVRTPYPYSLFRTISDASRRGKAISLPLVISPAATPK